MAVSQFQISDDKCDQVAYNGKEELGWVKAVDYLGVFHPGIGRLPCIRKPHICRLAHFGWKGMGTFLWGGISLKGGSKLSFVGLSVSG